jgi:Peptidase A4 family
MPVLVRVAPVALILVAVGCSTGPDAPTGVSSSAVMASVGFTLPRGGTSVLSVHTLPNATCQVLSSGALPAPGAGLTVFADDEGIARLELRHVDSNVAHAALALDCTDEAGTRRTHPIDVDVQPGASSQAAEPVSVAGKRVIPALQVDPQSLTAQEVIARGYPPRPDAVKAPAAYAQWLAFTAQPHTFIAPHMAAKPLAVHGPARIANGSETSYNWSGYYITTTPTSYEEIFGAWTVPSVSADPSSTATFMSSLWVGIDGASDSTDVVQAGTDQYVWVPSGVQVSGYYAWTEWYPQAESIISNFPINAGDEVQTWVWIGASDCSWVETGGYGCLYIYDVTQNLTSFTDTPIPAGVAFMGHEVEWIMEAPESTSTNASFPLPNYGTATMSSSWAADTNHYAHDYTSDTSYQLTMINHSNATLATAAPNGPSSITFTYVASQ